jgi:hypothetical protein
MEPVPRPEWASPIELGVHARSFYSALPEQPTRAVLQALHSDPAVLSFLERHQLGRLEFSGRMPEPSWRGWYDPGNQELVVNAFRSPDTYGKQFYFPELESVSFAGSNLVEALQRTLYHEIGHHLLTFAGPEEIRQIERLRRSGRAFPVSQRATEGVYEYFSETFSAYRFEDSLADKDPEGYDMIEQILRFLWKR